MRALLLFSIACTDLPAPAPAPQCSAAEGVALDTQDGARIHLHRHPGSGPPVILIHGIAANHRCLDLTPERSLAVSLQEAGFDPWLLDLRGHGDAVLDKEGDRQQHGWSLDDYGQYDLGRAVEYVREHTGADSVALIGHSMGGMVAAAYHAYHGDDALSAIAVIASPIAFDNKTVLVAMGGMAMGIGTVLPSIGVPTYAGWLASIGGSVPVHGEGILFNPRNLSPEARVDMLRSVVSPLSREELRQFSRIMRQGRFTSADGVIDYVDALDTLSRPLLVIAGSADHIAPVRMVQPWIEASGSPDETWVEAGKQYGFTHDYGHLDLPLGDAAAAEIYPLITGWLKEHVPTTPLPPENRIGSREMETNDPVLEENK